MTTPLSHKRAYYSYIISTESPHPSRSECGVTLIELMISMVLGLLVVAAAFQVFFISQRTNTTQKSASSVQDAGVYGLQELERHIRLANHGFGDYIYTGNTSGEGALLLTAENAAISPTAINPLKDRPDMFTRKDVGDSRFDSVKSDQLTIQFKAPTVMLDCEGRSRAINDWIIQRYYLAPATGGGFNLMCDADATNGLGTELGSDAVVLIPNVDIFRVQLMTSAGLKEISTYLEDLAALPPVANSIHGVKLGLVVAGATPTLQAPATDTFNVLGTTLKLPESAPKTVRRIYEPTILFRNARGS